MALAAVAAAERPRVATAAPGACCDHGIMRAGGVAFAAHVPATFVLEQRVQRIEDRVRVPMATYLDKVVKPGERVVSESAGYVGYYSGVTLYDYPGLTSPGAVETLEELRAPGCRTA